MKRLRFLLIPAMLAVLIGSAYAEWGNSGAWDSGVIAVITGGTINNTVIGGTTPAAGTFTNLGATGTLSDRLNRDFTKTAMTNGDTQTALTEANMLNAKYFSNQGDTVETDVILVAVSYPITVIGIVEEALIMEVCPPSGELFDHDGTDLDADDCVDMEAVVGTKMAFTRIQIADGTWRWSLDTIRGNITDTGATD